MKKFFCVSVAAGAVLAACGGGGGDVALLDVVDSKSLATRDVVDSQQWGSDAPLRISNAFYRAYDPTLWIYRGPYYNSYLQPFVTSNDGKLSKIVVNQCSDYYLGTYVLRIRRGDQFSDPVEGEIQRSNEADPSLGSAACPNDFSSPVTSAVEVVYDLSQLNLAVTAGERLSFSIEYLVLQGLPVPYANYVGVDRVNGGLETLDNTDARRLYDTPAGAGEEKIPGAKLRHKILVAVPAYWAFGGFQAPINPDAMNSVKAGQGVPVKFSFGEDKGMDILDGVPQAIVTSCTSGEVEPIEETVSTAGSSGLQYDPLTKLYTYVWKTDKKWTGCRQLAMKFKDGSTHRASFQFNK
ncbi:PxKF domain-containing protein [Ramlibacter sp. AN1015]|uniref:PxKF domain-containing protein n=1 Tax=Ramlibacter sp. AN1015 TaxID=3133428 RepID=UPI0030BBBA52